MKKILLAIMILIHIGCDSKPKIYNVSDIKNENDIYYDKSTNDKLNGILKLYGEDGTLLMETPYKDGIANGVAKSYSKSGILLAEVPYKDAKITGVWKSYNESGILVGEVTYVDKKKNGVMKIYSPSGMLVAKANFQNDKVINGAFYNLDGSKERDMTRDDFTKFGFEF